MMIISKLLPRTNYVKEIKEKDLIQFSMMIIDKYIISRFVIREKTQVYWNNTLGTSSH